MTITDKEYRDLLSFFAIESSAHHIISLALTTDANDSVGVLDTMTMISPQATLPTLLQSDTIDASDDNRGEFINLTSVDFAEIFAATSSTAASSAVAVAAAVTTIFNGNDTINATLSSTLVNDDNDTGPIIPRISPEMPIWLIPCYSIILLFAIVGNLLVISTLVQNRRMRTITNLFLLNLAISDILLGVLCMPVTLVGTLLRHFIFGEFFCKLIQFSQATSVAVSSWTLVAISCERYYAICHPLRSRTWQTINHAYRIIGFIWFGSMVCMTPIAIFSCLMPTSRQGFRKCRDHWPEEGYERSYNLFLDLILLVLPLLILCIAYILITRTLYVGMRNERAMIFGGMSSTNKVNTQVEAVATVTTTLMPSSGFNLNMSFRCHKQRNNINHNKNGGNNGGGGGGGGGIGGGGGGGGGGNDSVNVAGTGHVRCDMMVNNANHNNSSCSGGSGSGVSVGGVGVGSAPGGLIVQQGNRKQRRQKNSQSMQCYEDNSTHMGSKRKLLTATDGRRHLYCMRSASVKSLNRPGGNSTNNNNGIAGATPSPSPSMTVINVPQQQRFQLHQQRQQHHDSERRKSNSTPSLRITEAALRRSNETKNLESKKRVVKMLFVLVLEFFICWTPLYVINTLTIFVGSAVYDYIDYTSISFFQLLAYSSSCCNPITYCFMNAGFRRAFLDTFKGMHLSGGRIWGKRTKTATNLSVAGNSIALASSGTIMSTNTMLDSPRL